MILDTLHATSLGIAFATWIKANKGQFLSTYNRYKKLITCLVEEENVFLFCKLNRTLFAIKRSARYISSYILVCLLNVCQVADSKY